MTHEQWLGLPYLVRLWRVLTCSHPFDGSRLVGRVFDPTRNVEGYRYVCNVRECSRCRANFLDAGLITPDLAEHWRSFTGSRP